MNKKIGKVEISLNKSMSKVTLKKKDASITMTTDDFEDIAKEITKNTYYRADVVGRIEALIEDGKLPKKALKNENFIDSVLDEYSELRQENDGGDEDCFMTWTECLEEALQNNPYSEFAGKKK